MPTRDPADPLAGDKEAAQRRLLRLLKERMNGHLDELMAVLGDPPDLGKLTPAFWETEAGKMAAVLRPEIERMALAGANAMANTVAVLWDEAVIAREAADWALSYVGQLISGIDSHTLDLVRRQVRAFIDTPGMTIGDLRNSLLPAFGERRAQMIAVTETTAAYQAGQRVIQQELERGGLRRLRKWNTAGDEKVCDLCGPLDQTTEDTWTDTQGPPRHPNCRCWTTFVRPT